MTRVNPHRLTHELSGSCESLHAQMEGPTTWRSARVVCQRLVGIQPLPGSPSRSTWAFKRARSAPCSRTRDGPGIRCIGNRPAERPRGAFSALRGPTVRSGSQMAAVADRRVAGGWPLDAERCRLGQRHVRLAEKIARQRCPWGQEDPDDTRSDAFWGLTLAGRALDPGRGSFTAYAACRIEYSIRRGRQIRSGIPRSAWEKGDRGGPVSLNAAVRKDGPADNRCAPGSARVRGGLAGRRAPTAAGARSSSPQAALLPRSQPVGDRTGHRTQPDAGLADRASGSREAAQLDRRLAGEPGEHPDGSSSGTPHGFGGRDDHKQTRFMTHVGPVVAVCSTPTASDCAATRPSSETVRRPSRRGRRHREADSPPASCLHVTRSDGPPRLAGVNVGSRRRML